MTNARKPIRISTTPNTIIRASLPLSGKGSWRDQGFRGLEIRGNQAGGRWSLRTRIGAKRVRIQVGEWPGLDNEAAREVAGIRLRVLAGEEAAGRDAGAQLEQQRNAKAAIRQAPPLGDVFKIVSLAGVSKKASDDMREASYWLSHLESLRSAEKRSKELARFLKPFLKQRPGEISSSALLRHIDAEALKAPAQTARALRTAKPLWRWMAKSPRLWCGDPLADVTPQKDKVRERSLSLHEVGRIWQAINAEEGITRPLVKTMLLTAQRRGDVGGMTIGEIDFEGRLWTIPASRTKTGSAYLVPLSDEVLDQIREAIEISGGTDFVFKGRGDNPWNGWSVLQKRLRGLTEDLEHWQFHDFRSAFMSRMLEDRVPIYVVDRCLNHTAASTSTKIQRQYLRTDLLEERRSCFEAWSETVLSTHAVLDGDNVVALGDAR